MCSRGGGIKGVPVVPTRAEGRAVDRGVPRGQRPPLQGCVFSPCLLGLSRIRVDCGLIGLMASPGPRKRSAVRGRGLISRRHCETQQVQCSAAIAGRPGTGTRSPRGRLGPRLGLEPRLGLSGTIAPRPRPSTRPTVMFAMPRGCGGRGAQQGAGRRLFALPVQFDGPATGT